LYFDDARSLDYSRNQGSGDIRRDRFAALGRALRREPVEAQLAQPVIKPFMVRQLSGIDADELGQPLGTRHETNHVLRRVVSVDHQGSARRHPEQIIPTLDHGLLDQHDDVGVLVFVGERVLDYAVAHATVLARWSVGAIGIVNIVLHRLRELALDAGGSRDGIDDVASLFVHDDAPRPNGEFRVTHDPPSTIANSRPMAKILRWSKLVKYDLFDVFNMPAHSSLCAFGIATLDGS